MTVYAWAVQEFFETWGFYPDDENPSHFTNKSGVFRFDFEIEEDETEETLTEGVRKIINEMIDPADEEAANSDWNLLLERFRVLDGTEDQSKENEEEDEETNKAA